MSRRGLTCLFAASALFLGMCDAHAQDDPSVGGPVPHSKGQRASGKARSRNEEGRERGSAAVGTPAARGTDASAAQPQASATATAAPPSMAPAAPVICTLNREVIINTAAINVASGQRLAQLRQSAQSEIAEATKTLQADTKALDADPRPPTDEAVKRARDALSERGRAINRRAELLGRELNATLSSVNQQIQAAALPIIRDIEKGQVCSLLLGRDVVLDGNTVDITQPVLTAMDAQLHSRPFDLVSLTLPATQ